MKIALFYVNLVTGLVPLLIVFALPDPESSQSNAEEHGLRTNT